MTEEHTYGKVSHKEIVLTDPLESMQLSIATLTETVQELEQRINIRSGDTSALAYPKQTIMQDDRSVFLYSDLSSSEGQDGSVNEEPLWKLSKCTRLLS